MRKFEDYLRLPYTEVLYQDEEGDFVARIDELAGCVAHGPSREDALAQLDAVKAEWITDALERGDRIPEPEPRDALPSGKWVQRVPRSLHRKLVNLAKREGVSLNQLVTSVVAEHVGRKEAPGTVSTELTAPVAGRVELLSPMTLYLAHVATDLNVCFAAEPISFKYGTAIKAKNWETELETAPRKGLVQA